MYCIKYIAFFSAVDYSDLSAIALKLYQRGIEEVSSTAMLKNTLKFNKNEHILEVSEPI